jgi:SAM-dependent methyltransferase
VTYSVRASCRLCAAKLPDERVLDLGETALANELKSTREESLAQDKFPLYLVQCEKCGHVQLPIVVPAERLFPPDYPYESGTTATFRDHLWKQAKWLTERMGGPGRVLEVASNDGTLLRYLAELGHIVVGIDPAGQSVEGLMVYREAFTEDVAERIAAEHEPFDAVVANNVFAHVDDLDGFTRGVAKVLRHRGLFVFEVGYLPRVCGRGLLGTIYHEHLSFHHRRPLLPFLADRGLWVRAADEVDSQGGSIRVTAERSMILQQLAPALCVPDKPDLLELDRHRLRLREKATAITAARLAGKRVCGYGAPAKLTPLLAATGIADDLECVFDDNPRKVGKFTPGTGIPILASAELATRKPDVLVLFSANFADEIKSRHPGFTGEWVVL